MFSKWIFNAYSDRKKVEVLQEKATLVGTRIREGRKVFLYLLNNLFVEVLYVNDNESNPAEHFSTFTNVQDLNFYLEKEFKTSF